MKHCGSLGHFCYTSAFNPGVVSDAEILKSCPPSISILKKKIAM